MKENDAGKQIGKLKQVQQEAIDKTNEKDANSLNSELFEMEGFTPAPKYEKYLKIALLILALLSPIIIYLLFVL